MKEFQKLKEVQTFKRKDKFNKTPRFDKVKLEEWLMILCIKEKLERRAR